MADYDEVAAGGEAEAVDTRSMLSDFYGAMMADQNDEQQTSEEQERAYDDDYTDHHHQHQHASTLSQSPPAPRASRVDPALDLDSDRFQPSLYVDSLLATRSMKELLDADNRLVAQKRSLDSDMQMLVYENYSKFISATDMVRKMKENVESMEARMEALVHSMHTIRDSTAAIEHQFTPHRAKVENLVGVSRLLKRLEFLFELPGRLTKSIELGAHAQAVKYFRVSVNILSQYQHLKSFADIRAESEAIIDTLKQSLRQTLLDPHISTDTQLANTAMLIDLLEPPRPLLESLLNDRAKRFQSDMQKCVELQAVALKKHNANTKAKREREREIQAVLEADNGGIGEDSRSNPFDAAEDAPIARKRSAARRASLSDAAEVDAATDLLSLLSSDVLASLSLFARSYHDAITVPIEHQLRAAKKPNAAKEEILAACNQCFQHFSATMNESFLRLAKKELNRLGTVDAASSTNEIQSAVSRLTRALAAFSAQVSALLPVCGASASSLESQRDEILELSVRHCTACLLEHAQRQCSSLLASAHAEISRFNALQVAMAMRADGHADDAELAEGVIGCDIAPVVPSVAFPAAAATALAAALRQVLESCLDHLAPVIDTKRYLPNLRLSFTELAHSQFHSLLSALCQTLTMRALRKSEGPVFEPQTSVNPALAHATDCTLFLLYLSQVCVYLEAKELPTALRALRKHFPLSSAASAKDPAESKLLARLRENAQLLLARFVEVHGARVQRVLREELRRHARDTAASAESGNVGPIPAVIHRLVLQVQVELAQIMPKRKEPVSSARGSSGANHGGGVTRDFARLFRARSATFGPVRFTRVDPLIAALRVSFKAWSECARLQHFTTEQAKRMEAAIGVVRRELPRFVREPDDGVELSDDIKALHAALEDVRHSVSDRSQSNAFAFDMVSESELDDIYQHYRRRHAHTR